MIHLPMKKISQTKTYKTISFCEFGKSPGELIVLTTYRQLVALLLMPSHFKLILEKKDIFKMNPNLMVFIK